MDPVCGQPSKETLLSIAERVTTHFECEALAIRLGLEDELVRRLLSEYRDPRKIALDVLKEWVKRFGPSATGSALYKALEKIGDLSHIAREFSDALQVGGNILKWQLVCGCRG